MRFLRNQFAVLTLLSLALAATAQMHHVDAPEKTTRAVGVYEWTGELSKPTAARLVPVSVFIAGRMEQAGTYLARPVPLALETGNLYSVEKAGQPEGLLNIKIARDVASQRSAADDNPIGAWYGYGVFAVPSPPKKSNLKPTVNVAGISGSGDDDRPHFVAPRAQAPDAKTAKSAPVDDADPEKPTLGRRDESADAADKEKKPKKAKPAGYVTGVGIDADDPDRPTLRHGSASVSDTPPLEGLPEGMHQAVAVSDPAIKDAHVFAREWDSAQERAETMAAMQKLAAADARAYLIANSLLVATAADQAAQTANETASAAPKLVRTPHGVSTKTSAPPAKKATAKKAAPADGPLPLEGEDLHGYNLTYGGLPTFVYTADVPVKAAKAQTAALTVHVMEIAQRLPSGDLQVALKAATDSGHLDRTPWTRFVDVVDADGSHRASFLLEERAAHSRQFALYRLVSATAEQTFVTGLLE